ncbi:hypothetical protein J18TS1_30600 [Oceanobacillus oncorhynchi subsp. incaldanensis]|uniref:Uncharacterized protein n=1 Tax=Oceanobacillus aidingensis TaxID=645964 RepID=A0ABV9K3Y8_9BACI|nr:hypothetical protein [Oceanobacillus oncorhynchi]MDM8099638.1 hypothetical protein [Oceanobacillus oncorhynchi]UUI41909.1 hypothetical protein NP440_10445 [Oceanobacillus oncorhynchi]GIO19960.1 hypothetical protein J18TS1_30600 [Oceanobacillus oncorhynchi subsp. incaldanensis]
MKGSYVVLIILLLILLTGFFTWLWLQNFNENQESIAALVDYLV